MLGLPCIREVSCVLLSDVELQGYDPNVSTLLLCGPLVHKGHTGNEESL